MKQMLHTKAVINKANVEEAGIIRNVVGSSAVVDRMGDIIDQGGWNLKDYLNNKVILWGHNVREERPPIAKALKVWVQDKGTKNAKLMFDLKFDLQDSFAAEIYRKIKEGFLNTVSVGFLPHEWEELDPDNWFGGLKFTKQDLLELSIVPVPANPEALIQLNSMAKSDKRFTPVEEKDIFEPVEDNRFKKMMKESKPVTDDKVKEVKETELIKELRSIEDFQEGSFRALKLKKNDKEYVAIVGKLKDTDTFAEQSLRFNKDAFTEEEIKDDENESTDTAVTEPTDTGETTETEEVKEDVTEEVEPEKAEPEDEVPDSATEVEAEGDTNNDGAETVDDKKEETEVTADEQENAEVKSMQEKLTQIKAGRVISAKNEAKLTQANALIDEVLAQLEKAEEVEVTEDEEEEKSANVIPFKSFGTCADSEVFDGPGEVAKSTCPELKDMCAWFDSEKAEDKSSYKLIHHRAEDKKAVWRGVASAMALLMGAKDGGGIPAEDRKGVYDHLVEHYKEFEKEAPDFELVEKQVLANLDEEVHALTLDREDKHMVRLIKKILENQKTEKKSVKPSTQVQALEVIDKALSKVNIRKGGE